MGEGGEKGVITVFMLSICYSLVSASYLGK